MKVKRGDLKARIDMKELTRDPTAGRAYRKLIEAGAKAEQLEHLVGIVVLTYGASSVIRCTRSSRHDQEKVGRVS
jgi:hypothetical protein